MTAMDLREITDFNAPELDVYARLTENQLVNRADPANALFIAESPLVIGRALDAGCVPVSFLMERKHVEGKASELLARCPADIPVYAAPLEVLEQLTGFKLTRGMLCAMRRPQLPTVERVCAGARRVAVLENVMNPTNIGAIFRRAAEQSGQRPAVPPRRPGQYGDGVSDPVDVFSGGCDMAGGRHDTAAAVGVQNRRHGIAGRFPVH